MKHNRKKFIWPVLAASFCVLLGAGSFQTFCYFTDRDVRWNLIQPGSVITLLEEEFPDPDPIPPDQEQDYVKKVTVKNTASVPVYVRMLVACSDSVLEDSLAYVNLNTESWKAEGAYYYYVHPLLPGEETEPLFEGVKILLDGEGAWKEGDTASIYCYEESVQTVHGSRKFENYRKAWEFYAGGQET